MVSRQTSYSSVRFVLVSIVHLVLAGLLTEPDSATGTVSIVRGQETQAQRGRPGGQVIVRGQETRAQQMLACPSRKSFAQSQQLVFHWPQC